MNSADYPDISKLKLLEDELLNTHPIEIFKDESITRAWKCSICLNVVFQPALLNPCGHCFCRDHILEHFQTSGRRTCALCKQEVESLSNNLPQINAMLQEAKVVCPMKVLNNKACNWSGKLEELKAHLTNQCEFVHIICFCGHILNRSALQNEKAECNCSERPCQYCQNSFIARFLQKHETQCKKVEVAHHCGLLIRREHMRVHERETCIERIIPCKYNIVGCQQTMKFKDQYEHFHDAEASHYILLRKYLSVAEKQIKALELKAARTEEELLKREADYENFKAIELSKWEGENDLLQSQLTSQAHELALRAERIQKLELENEKITKAIEIFDIQVNTLRQRNEGNGEREIQSCSGQASLPKKEETSILKTFFADNEVFVLGCRPATVGAKRVMFLVPLSLLVNKTQAKEGQMMLQEFVFGSKNEFENGAARIQSLANEREVLLQEFLTVNSSSAKGNYEISVDCNETTSKKLGTLQMKNKFGKNQITVVGQGNNPSYIMKKAKKKFSFCSANRPPKQIVCMQDCAKKEPLITVESFGPSSTFELLPAAKSYYSLKINGALSLEEKLLLITTTSISLALRM